MRNRIFLFLITAIFINSCGRGIIGGVLSGLIGGIGMGQILLLVLFLLLPYFLPSVVAARSGHKNTWLIVLSNILFGWTGIGWLIVLIWASEGGKRSTQEKAGREDNPKWTVSQLPTEDSKKCPICAEIIKVEALKCRFCGEDFREEILPRSENSG